MRGTDEITSRLTSDQAIARTAELLKAGKIMAIKGLGGFHLACDARNSEAIKELRRRKGRTAKPFAVMSADLEEVRRFCQTTPDQERLLTSAERPIVLLPTKPEHDLSDQVAPNNLYFGVMLPYTPLHQLILESSPQTLIMTSGNLSEEPITYQNEQAKSRLGRIADHFLTHNRDIQTPCDDSVVRPIRGEAMLIRRARGYVPRPIDLGFEAPAVLACGAQDKNTFCLTQGSSALLGPHIGDLDNAETLSYYERCIQHCRKLFKIEPTIIAYDLHPEYLSTKYALSQSGVELQGIQHHHAHIVSAMIDNQLTDPEREPPCTRSGAGPSETAQVIGVAFDGTGYGTDGTIWGGEFLIADQRDFRRAAHLAHVPLPGGAASIRKPPRMAFSYLLTALGEQALDLVGELLPQLSVKEAETIRRQIEHNLNSPQTSSMGRLFDAVSALLGLCAGITYEGQAAVELEMLATPARNEIGRYDYRIEQGDNIHQIEVTPMMEAIVADLKSGIDRALIAAKFHRTISHLVVEVCARLREETGLDRVVLSGGVFQNLLLAELLLDQLTEAGLRPYTHHRVPPNDGGISLGQAAIAARRSQCA